MFIILKFKNTLCIKLYNFKTELIYPKLKVETKTLQHRYYLISKMKEKTEKIMNIMILIVSKLLASNLHILILCIGIKHHTIGYNI